MHLNISIFIMYLILSNGVCSQRQLQPGHKKKNDYKSPIPRTYLKDEDMPNEFSWIPYLTRSLNQHLPHYCGSCWAHAAMSSLADRIKIARIAVHDIGPDINLSIQFLLNCGTDIAGSCKGGSASGAYEFIKKIGFIPYETCQPYLACSVDSDGQFCNFIDTSCSPMNTCRTCTNPLKGGHCSPIFPFPNATVAEYGVYHHDVKAVMAEIYARGPVTAGVAGSFLKHYEGGIISDMALKNMTPTHEVSIVGWGLDPQSRKQYWIVRNSWGEYWGEMSFFRILLGENLLGVEEEITWSIPGQFTVKNRPCWEDGLNCMSQLGSLYYQDPSIEAGALGRLLS